MCSHVVGVRFSVVGVVRPSVVMNVVCGTIDPVSVCHRKNIYMQMMRHGVVFVAKHLMPNLLRFTLTMCRLQTPSGS